MEEPELSGKVNEILKTYEKILESFPLEFKKIRFTNDDQLVFLIVVCSPYVWKPSDQLMNLFLWKLQGNRAFLISAYHNLKKIITTEKESFNERPQLFKKGSIFNKNFWDFECDEVLRNSINLKFVALEYLNKLMVIVSNYNRSNKDHIKFDVDLIFNNVVRNLDNVKIFKKIYKILQEHGCFSYFYSSADQYRLLENEVLQKINENQTSVNSSFEKDSKDLSDLLVKDERP